MPSSEIGASRLRFLPAAVVPHQLRRQIELALDDVVAGLYLRGEPAETEGARKALEAVRAELSRHSGKGAESCIVTKEAIFAMSEQLDRSSRLLSEAGRHAASLVAAAIDDRLLALVAELQPVAPV